MCRSWNAGRELEARTVGKPQGMREAKLAWMPTGDALLRFPSWPCALPYARHFPSLRFRIGLRGTENERLITFQRATAQILRTRQRFLGEFRLAELAIGQGQLIMDVSEMV